MQAVGDDFDIVQRQLGDAVRVVRHELAHHTCLDGDINIIIGFVLLQYAVALVFDGLVGFIHGEVEGCREISIFPRFALFDEIAVVIIVWHRPYDDGNGAYH